MTTTRRDDDGFTLVEVLVAGIIGSIIISAIASTFIVGLRTTEATADRMSTTFDAQLVSNYLLPDVQSAGTAFSDLTAAPPPGGAPPCTATTTSGTTAMTAAWRETQPLPTGATTTTYESTYRVTVDRQLVRTHRVNGTAVSTDVLARSVDWAEAQISGDRVNLCVRVGGVYSATVTGYRRSTSEVSTGGPPAVGPPPCAVETAIVSPLQGRRSGLGVLFDAHQLTVTTIGPRCANLRVKYHPAKAGRYDKDFTPAEEALLVLSGGTWSTSLNSIGWPEAGDFELALLWSDTALSFQNLLGTVDFQVRTVVPCAVNSLVLDPSAGTRDRNPSPGALTQGRVTVTATTEGECAALTLRYDPTTTGTPPTGTTKSQNFTRAGDTWQAIVPDTELWSDGRHPLQAWEGTDDLFGLAPLATVNIDVAPRACGVTKLAASPNPVNRSGGPNAATNTLQRNVVLTADISGVCSGLQVQFTPHASPVSLNLQEAADGRTWTVTIDRNAYQWSLGNKRIEVLREGTAVGTSTDLVVQ